ncbi:MAG: [FeFe] hydrogenase H-cluster radical SAM maturase HydG [Patescibacteria group bacterium]
MFQLNNQKIFFALKENKNSKSKEVLKILKKAENLQGLNLNEAAILINCRDKKLIEKIKEIAHQVKLKIYGNRIVLFAPLYVSNFCVNDCEYCGFHVRNRAPRKKLAQEEIKKQVEILEDMGHKRLLLEFGEDPKENPIDYVVETIKTIYKTRRKRGSIRRVNVNIAATTLENFKKLKAAKIGTYQLFQETYHKPTYQKLHRGPKADYNRQIQAHDLALKAKIDDLGIGVLFGLYDWRYEVLSLISHAQYMEKKFGVGPHTISVPRFCKASTVDYQPKYPVSDEDFLKLIAILRLAVPYTGMIMSTRERPEIRRQSFWIGISQTSAGSRTEPGGYSEKIPNSKCQIPNKFKIQNSKLNLKQFELHDQRSLDEVVFDICKIGYLPSFCTACYRVGRTGDNFMKYAKTGQIQNFCLPNALLTFYEYLLDYASQKTQEVGKKIVAGETEKIKNDIIRKELKARFLRLERGERDLYF